MNKKVYLILLILVACVIMCQSNVCAQAVDQDAEVRQLIAIVKDKRLQERKPQKVIDAINRLSTMKSIIAIDELINVITLRKPDPGESKEIQKLQSSSKFFMSVYERYPATAALVAIGEPTLPALLNLLQAKGKDSAEGRNALMSIIGILGSKTKTINYLTSAANHTKSSEDAQELLNAANELRDILNSMRNAGVADE